MADPLISFLKLCCREVIGDRPGTGFFVSPHLLVTCRHVIGKREIGSRIPLRRWDCGPDEDSGGILLSFAAKDDLALLRLEKRSEEYAALQAGAKLGDRLVGLGFPRREGRREFDQVELRYEGQTLFRDDEGLTGAEEKLKAGQLVPGFSGGPLLNFRTGAVMGVLVASRDRGSALGGWAIAADAVRNLVEESGSKLSKPSLAWREAAREQQSSAAPPRDSRRDAPFQAEGLPLRYVPRTDLLEPVLERLLESPGHAGSLSIMGLHGSGGMGKSTLARAIAHSRQVRSLCPDGVLWANLGQTPQLLPQLIPWVEATVSGSSATLSIESCTSILRSALRDKSMLLVIDDVWEVDHARPFLVGGPSCRVLVTTRRAHLLDLLSADSFPVDALKPEQSLELIRQYAPSRHLSEAETEELRTLTAAIDQMPLAVQLVGAMLNRGLSVSELRTQVAPRDRGRGSGARYKSQALESVDACLSLSISYLRLRNRAAWEMFLILGIVPAGSSLTAERASELWGIAREDAERLLWTLTDDALLMRSEQGFRIHDLMHDVAGRLLQQPGPHGLGKTWAEVHNSVVERYQSLVPQGRWDLLPPERRRHCDLMYHAIETGDPAKVNAIIRSKGAGDSFAWFVALESLGGSSGYSQNLSSALAFFTRHEKPHVADQLFCCLAKSSVNSVYSSMSEALVGALVEFGLWSPLTGYHWIREFRNDARRINYLITLVHAASQAERHRPGADEAARRVRAQALAECLDYLLAQPASQRVGQLWARIFDIVPEEDRAEVVSRINRSPEDLEQRVAFVSSLPEAVPAKVRRGLLLETCNLLPELDDIARRIRLLTPCLRHLPDEDRFVWGDRLAQWLRQLDLPSGAASATAQRPPGPGTPEPEGLHRPVKANLPAILPNEPESEDSLPDPILFETNLLELLGDHEFATEFRNCLIYLDHGILLTIEELLRLREGHVSINWTLSVVRHLCSLEEVEKDRKGDPLRQLDQVIAHRHFDDAFGMIGSLEGDKAELCLRVFEGLNEYGDEYRLCVAMLPLWPRMTGEQRAAIVSFLEDRFPHSTAASMLAAANSVDPFAYSARITAGLERLGGKTLEKAAILCISLGLGKLADLALSRIVRIGDSERQAGTVFALMPYLPRALPLDVLAAWRDEGMFGTQIATLTQIMSELVDAISADALVDIIQAAVNLHSEWWVVEALTDTLLRVSSRPELNAVIGAAGHLQNNDLRIRTLGRVARRAADFGLHDLALYAIGRMPDGPLQWDEMIELASRMAAGGETEGAFRAAESISSTEERSRAHALIAMEFAAQGKSELYRKATAAERLTGRWREWLEGIVGDHCPPPVTGQDRDPAAARRDTRRSFEPRRSQILVAVDRLRRRGECLDRLKELEEAVEHDDEPAVRRAIEGLWGAGSGTGLLAARLYCLTRPDLLERLAELAPLIGHLDEEVAVETIRAIRDVGLAWP